MIAALLFAWVLSGGPVPDEWHVPVARFALAVLASDSKELRDLERLAWVESRWNHRAVSRVGACGLWQVRPEIHGTSCERLQTRPLVSLYHAMQIARWCRANRPGCWQKCYQRGPWHPTVLGCKATVRQTAAKRMANGRSL